MKKSFMTGSIAVFLLCITVLFGCTRNATELPRKEQKEAFGSGILSGNAQSKTQRQNKDGCTTGASGKNANIYGAAMTWHTNDNELSDQSLYYTPAMDHDLKKNPWRSVYIEAVALDEYPVWHSYLTPVLNLDAAERGPDYDYGGQYPRSIRAGQIPQVARTHAYIGGSYGIINEHGLSFGECTNSSKFTIGPTDNDNGEGQVKRLFYTSELSRIALERCTTARQAIKLIGELIDTYGYWGTGETLPVADGEEAWIIEMSPAKDGVGGYWAAQRVPDDEVVWCANQFRIRTVRRGGIQDTLIVGDKIFADFGKDELDFLETVSHGEYNHPYYSLRRVWRALSLAAPSLKLSPIVENGYTKAYPFSVKPDKLLSLEDIIGTLKDHYEGTGFDLTKGPAAGIWGNPNRYNTHGFDTSGDVGTDKIQGWWNRSISWYYTGYAYISVSNRSMTKAPLKSLLWVALNVPGESCFVPLSVSPLPESYKKISSHKYDDTKAWWVYNRVAEECYKKYSILKKDVLAQANKNENESAALINELEHSSLASSAISEQLTANALRIQNEWKTLWHTLIVEYNQGFLNTRVQWAATLGYPEDFLLDKSNGWLKKDPYSYKQ